MKRYLSVAILGLVIAVGISSIIPTGLVSAQVPGLGNVSNLIGGGTGTSIPVKDDSVLHAIDGTKSGSIAGAIQSSLSQFKDKFAKSAGQTCINTINSFTSISSSTTLSNLNVNNVNLINGTPVLAVQNVVQAQALQKAKDCVDTYLAALDTYLKANPPTNLKDSNELASEQSKYQAISDALGKRAADAQAAASASWQDVLRAVLVKAISNFSKNLTTQLTNEMISKYKISDYLAYSDALATQVYSMKYINENYSGDAETALMIRSLIQSDKLPAQIKTVQAMATNQAQQYIGKACNATNPSAAQDDPMYWMNCVAAIGSAGASGDWRMGQVQDAKNATVAAGKTASALDASQSNGYAPPRNCSGSLAQQQQIDSQVTAAANAVDVASSALALLTSARIASLGNSNAPSVSDADMAKAQAALAQANANYQALIKKFNAGGGAIDPATGKPVVDPTTGKVQDGAIIDICEAIASPASFVGTSVSNFLSAQLNQAFNINPALSQSLPFQYNFLSDVASNFLTNILTGGKSTSQVLKEAGVGALNGTIISLNQAALQSNNSASTTSSTSGGTTTGNGGISGSAINQANNPVSVVAYQTRIDGAPPTTTLATNLGYKFIIDFSKANDLLSASSVKISWGSGLSDNATIDSFSHTAESHELVPANPGSLTMTIDFFLPNSTGSVMTVTKQFTIVSNIPAGGVAGAVTTVPFGPFLPRGPIAKLR